MQKYLIAGLMLFSWSLTHAGQDKFGSMRTPVWRSSFTNSADSFVLLATGNIIVHAIEIGSPTVNQADSYLSLFNSTTTNTRIFNFSTAAFINTGVMIYASTFTLSAPATVFPLQGTRYEYDSYFSSGVVYNKLGAAWVNILWDYVLLYDKLTTPWSP